MIKFLPTSICALALAGAALGASAAELGEIAPRSYIGQPLAVDIDLTALTPEEVAGLQVRLADQNVYRGANVTMNPALASVRLQVERRGAKSVLHVTTTRAVDADYVHLYVELGVPGKQDVRLATVWLQKDPNPAPVVVAAPPVPPVSVMTPAQAEQIVAQAKGARAATVAPAARPAVSATAKPVVAEAPVSGSAAEGAASIAPARDRSKPAPLPSVHEAETGAPGEVKSAGQAQRIAGVWVGADGKVLKTAPREEPAEVPMRVAQALLPLAPLPLPKGVKRPQASCAPTGMSAKECVALDNHNAELSSKLLELEGKMKVLQGALGATSSAAAISMTPPPVKAAGHGGAQAASVPAATAASASAANAATTAASSAAHTASAASAAASATAAHGGEGKGAASAPAEAEHGASTPANAAAPAASAQASASAGATDGASASAAASASAPPAGPVKQIRVLPKLKYKKEKPPEPQTDYTLPLAAGGIGLLALLGAGYFWWRKKKSGRGPLQIWQGFRKKKPAEPAADAPAPAPAAEAAPESVAS